jgi:xanthine dehydrogenase accessory factor
MNSSLLDRIDELSDAVLVTILSTEGHTYKKQGDKALYVDGNPFPAWGNLGTTCVDPHIIEAGNEARRQGKPTRIVVDTTDPADIHFGTGTFCGGRVELLIEPVLEDHKRVYRNVRATLNDGKEAALVHNLTTGALTVASRLPDSDPNHYVETFEPAHRLYIFGATPLAGHIVRLLEDTGFSIHISDWREGYLDALQNLQQVTFHTDEWSVDSTGFALVLSHNHERDLESLRVALTAGCRYVGLLSSTTRRDYILSQLKEEGFSPEQLSTVKSPAGVSINSRSDEEIAISIAAQLIQVKNQ